MNVDKVRRYPIVVLRVAVFDVCRSVARDVDHCRFFEVLWSDYSRQAHDADQEVGRNGWSLSCVTCFFAHHTCITLALFSLCQLDVAMKFESHFTLVSGGVWLLRPACIHHGLT